MVRPLPISLPLARNWMRERGVSRHQILLAIGNAAVVLAPRHFSGIGPEIAPADMVMNADLGAADAREKRLGCIRASAFV